jgi:hypothetical protein
MAHGAISVFNVTIASGATLSSEVDLGRSWAKVYIDPTGAASEVRFQAAASSGGTYRQVYLPQPSSTSTVQTNAWKVASAISGGVIEAPAGLRFVKVEATAAVANGATLKLYCSDC